MLNLASTIEAMKAKGMSADDILTALSCIQVQNDPVVVVDQAAERRRAADRARKASQRLRNSAESADKESASPSPKESPHTPKEITPSTPKETPLRGSKKGTRLPVDFEPDMALAAQVGLTRSQAETEATKFRNYWAAAPGQKGVKLDWGATWHNWVLKASADRPRAGPMPGKPKTAADFLLSETMDRIDASFRPETSDWADAGEFPGLTVAGSARRLGLPDGG